jgi:hypothetical protein
MERTTLGIYEPAIFQGKISEDSQATRSYLNDPNLTHDRTCHIPQIAKLLMSERDLDF